MVELNNLSNCSPQQPPALRQLQAQEPESAKPKPSARHRFTARDPQFRSWGGAHIEIHPVDDFPSSRRRRLILLVAVSGNLTSAPGVVPLLVPFLGDHRPPGYPLFIVPVNAVKVSFLHQDMMLYLFRLGARGGLLFCLCDEGVILWRQLAREEEKGSSVPP